MDILLLSLLVFAFLAGAATAFRRGPDDANWELRWRNLDDLDRAWIAAAVVERSKATRAALAARGEEELAAGFRRREWRRRAYFQLAALPLPISFVTLVLTGVFPDGAAGAILGLWAIVQGLVYYLRDSRIKAAYRAAQDLETALAA